MKFQDSFASDTYPQRPFGRSYWVVPGTFLAGFFPSDHQKQIARFQLNALIDCGIRTFVNLMETNETNYEGLGFPKYTEQIQQWFPENQLNIEFLRFPIRDMYIPDEPLMIQILDAIDQSLNLKKPIYLHCWGGLGRTGTVVGCWLIRHGIVTPMDAIKHIQTLRKPDDAYFRDSPQTGPQKDFILNWKKGN